MPNTSKSYVAAHMCSGVQETQGSVEASSSVGAGGSSPTGGRASGPTGGSETAIAGAAATAVLSNAPASLHIRPKVADKVIATCACCVLYNNHFLRYMYTQAQVSMHAQFSKLQFPAQVAHLHARFASRVSSIGMMHSSVRILLLVNTSVMHMQAIVCWVKCPCLVP